jgi:hypothetical protein
VRRVILARSLKLILASRFEYDGRVHIIPDVDGVRVLSNDVCEFLQKVPGELSSVCLLEWDLTFHRCYGRGVHVGIYFSCISTS